MPSQPAPARDAAAKPDAFHVAAFYQFTNFADPAALREPLLALCAEHGLRGTVLLAREGINGTIAGGRDAVAAAIAHIRGLPGCAQMTVKRSHTDHPPFHRMKVRLKAEIVTMGEPDIDPARNVGEYVEPEDWNALIGDPDTVLIDTRNDYEVGIGTFAGAIDPATPTFRDFPGWFRDHRAELSARAKRGQPTKFAMFCTGGIRCEKATAFLKSEGVEDVFHLKGGILSYLERVAPEDSQWRGECFVFDERVSVTQGLAVGTHELCRACRMPLSEGDRASPYYVEGVSCARCHDRRTAEQRDGYAERQRQTALAEARGVDHIGAKLRPDTPPTTASATASTTRMQAPGTKAIRGWRNADARRPPHPLQFSPLPLCHARADGAADKRRGA